MATETKAEEFQFASIEHVRQAYPRILTAAIHTVRPLSNDEATKIYRAQVRARGGSDVFTGSEASAIDLLELRGSVLSASGSGRVGDDTGPIYINHSYDPAREYWQDFAENDVVTLLFEQQVFRGKTELHAIVVYNHETCALVHCQSDLSFCKTERRGLVQVPLRHRDILAASQAILFLHTHNLIPQQGQQPRPLNDMLTNYEFSGARLGTKSTNSFSCMNVIGALGLIFFLLFAAMQLIMAFGK